MNENQQAVINALNSDDLEALLTALKALTYDLTGHHWPEAAMSDLRTNLQVFLNQRRDWVRYMPDPEIVIHLSDGGTSRLDLWVNAENKVRACCSSNHIPPKSFMMPGRRKVTPKTGSISRRGRSHWRDASSTGANSFLLCF